MYSLSCLYHYQNGRTALIYACSKGYTDIVVALIASGADPNIGDQVYKDFVNSTLF